MRDRIVDRLRHDLVGPLDRDEFLEDIRNRPTDRYLTGMLWPAGERIRAEEEEQDLEDDEATSAQATAPVSGQQRPSSMGLSFATTSSTRTHQVSVTVRFGTYRTAKAARSTDGAEIDGWQRTQHELTRSITLPHDGADEIDLEIDDPDISAALHVRGSLSDGTTVATVTLINRASAGSDRLTTEAVTLFQTELEVAGESGTSIVPRPDVRHVQDAEDEIARLLYRNAPEIAVGHQCSAGWTRADNGLRLHTTWLPSATVGAFRQDGHDVFRDAVTSCTFSAESLAEDDGVALVRRLTVLPDAYEQWIKLQHDRVRDLGDDYRDTARANLDRCREVLDRIRRGVQMLNSDANVRLAFRLANEAMAMQYRWRAQAEAALQWRPFQIGFILLSLESVCSAKSPDRQTLDLLWFPTGGGKTEAYLALVAMAAFHRRLAASSPHDGGGNVALMRYTLRLLTAQQFERATSLILACELIRRRDTGRLGSEPFAIGLWLGKDATPNSFDDSITARVPGNGASAEQITACPCCRARLQWDYDGAARSVRPKCGTPQIPDCQLRYDSIGLWPVFTVDEDIYRRPPTLVIGTIDKFASIPTQAKVGELFGLGAHRARKTSLIIQDELHLISGPLGSIAGLYEAGFDWLLRDGDDNPPKIIGSTATIRRASDQVRALFDRASCQFPPPGIDYGDSGFAVLDRDAPGRMHVAVTTAGRSSKFCLQAIAASLLQAGGEAHERDPQVRDGYSTLLCYFNALRELGGAIVLMLDDVQNSIRLLAERHHETPRRIAHPLELSSNATQREIVDALADLGITAGNAGCVDVVLATNMVSVGVDVPRLGLMLVVGQPKSRSEYIQATSRVGRSKFPGLVISVLNAGKPRDRSHFESFAVWHSALYRDVEATSVTPFAPRARERALHAALVSMLRHGTDLASLAQSPRGLRGNDAIAHTVGTALLARVTRIDEFEATAAAQEIDNKIRQWLGRLPEHYLRRFHPTVSLMQDADHAARAEALGQQHGSAWPTMNSMRSVEPSTRFRMVEPE
jgi:hypothetical protein